MTSDLRRRLERVERAIIPNGRKAAMESLASADFTAKWGEKYARVADAIREEGKGVVAQRMLDTGTPVERLIFLLQVGLCINAVMIMVTYVTGDPDGILPQWECESTQLLRCVAGLPTVPFEPVRFLGDDFPADASLNDAVKIFEAKRRKLRRA